MNDLNLFGPLQSFNLDDRRRRKRRPRAGEALITVIDGPLNGQQFDSISRDYSTNGISFLLKVELRVGQRIQIETDRDGRAAEPQNAEVVRSRLLSNGRWEIAAEFRKPQMTPRPSESQRRHERRKLRLERQAGNAQQPKSVSL